MVLDDDRWILVVNGGIDVGEGTLGDWVRLENIRRGRRAGLNCNHRTEIVWIP